MLVLVPSGGTFETHSGRVVINVVGVILRASDYSGIVQAIRYLNN